MQSSSRHSHADHIMGLDDVRPLNLRQKSTIPIYGSSETLATIQCSFRYIFENSNPESSIPKLTAHPLSTEEGIELFGLQFTPILLHHGRSFVYGYRFASAAYLTDHSRIPDASMQQLADLDVLFLDALRHKPHPTHTTVAQALEYVGTARAQASLFHAHQPRFAARGDGAGVPCSRAASLRRFAHHHWRCALNVSDLSQSGGNRT